MSYVPERGDVVWMDFDPQMGDEQAGRRPVLILSPQAYNSRIGMALCCPITIRVKGYIYEVTIPDGLNVRGVIMSDQIRSFDWRARDAEVLARLPKETIELVLAKLDTILRI